MANPLKCDFCAKPAKVHYSKIVANKVHKVDLCEECAKAKGVADPSGFSLTDLLLPAALAAEVPSAPGEACPNCGFTPSDFKKQGRFGCPACYDTFKSLLEPLLDNMHKGVTHTGKVPQKALTRKSLHDRLSKLEVDLNDAVQAERFEDAARFRDEINQVRKAVTGRPSRQPPS